MSSAHFDLINLTRSLQSSSTDARRAVERLTEDEATIAALRTVVISAARRSGSSSIGATERAELAARAQATEPAKARSHAAVLVTHESAANALVLALTGGCRSSDVNKLCPSVDGFLAAVDAAVRSAEEAMKNNQKTFEALCAAWEIVGRMKEP